MRKIGIFRIIAIIMGLHFCGVSVCTYDNDSIVIESESDSDSESEDSKEEHKLISLQVHYSEIQILQKKVDSFFTQSDWCTPHIEITSPPPELI